MAKAMWSSIFPMTVEPNLEDFPWAAQIASSPKVRDVKISPDGSMILYQVVPFYKSNRAVSELWLAQTDFPRSARPLTNGLFNDCAGVFHPDGKRVVFLSDRHNPGKPGHIYVLDLNIAQGTDSEPMSLTPNAGKKGVQAFEISPDGRLVAFTSNGEVSLEEEGKRVEENSDARVFGGDVNMGETSRLRIYSFMTGIISTLDNIRKDRQIESFTWSPDSKRLLYRLRRGRGSEFTEQEIALECVSVEDPSQTPFTFGSYPRSPSGRNIWTSSGHVISLESYEPSNTLDARALFARHPGWPLYSVNSVKRLYGLTEDAVSIVNISPGTRDGDFIAVEVCSNINTHIDIVSFDPSEGTLRTLFTLFRTHQEGIWFGAWDAKKAVGEDGSISYIFASVLSSGIRHEPPNVWAGRVSGEGREISTKLQLSTHLQWLVEAPVVATETIRWKRDGIELDGLIRYPPRYDASKGPLPTVLFIHGGPYRRDIPDYMPYFCNWREVLALAGYLVISPNYRGSQGRGHEFAHAASQGIGVYDWPDCESMVDEVIRRGLADPMRLGIAGWSHGGSLTAWGVTKTKNRFKAAIVGAGVSNWEGMVMDSGSPELEAAIGQSAPWDYDGWQQSTRKTSPIHSVANVTTAVLILHGEKDERVPVGQGIGLWRGLKRRASERGRQSTQLVIYPREPHGFVERKHAEDVLKRVVSYFNTWL